MLKSMTGFGKSNCELADKNISIEIRSLNSKQTDINTKIHPIFRDKDIVLRNIVQQNLVRGKIDININYEVNENAKAAKLNTGVVSDYSKQIKVLAREQKLDLNEEIFASILRMPDVLTIEKDKLSDEEWKKIENAFKQAIEELNQFRLQEGSALEKDLELRVSSIEKLLTEITPFEQSRIEATKQKLESALKELKSEDIDRNRFEQELIFYLEKLDITEEKVRLTNHLKYFREIMQLNEAVGKKLGFIAQEIGREINTIGSKANNADIQKIVVLMKDELEKIKEQSLNVL
jgi:uncharacterized protein (TIGR00255 family)